MNLFVKRLGAILRRGRKEQDIRDELLSHIEQEEEDLQAGGMSAGEARHAARRELGNFTLVQEETRAVWIWTWAEQLILDCRYGVRTMAANKTFSLLAILSLALGVGANTAIYSFMDWLLMRSLPVADPGSLVVLNWRALDGSGRDSVVASVSGSIWRDGTFGRTSGIFPYPAFELIQRNSDDFFSSVFAYHPTGRVNVMAQGQAELARGEFVSGQYFSGLGVAPFAGRLIVPDDDRVGGPAVAVLSFAYSERRFGEAARATGQSILINNLPFAVAGVAPPGFFGVDPAASPDFYVPLRANLLPGMQRESDEKRYLAQNYYWLEMMARLRPGVSLEKAQAAMGPLFHHWVESTARNSRERANLPELRIREGATGLDTLRRRYSQPLYVLLAMVGMILAIVCVNIANLLLARAASRRREMAVRLSIGAGRLRVIRQLLTESVLLSAIGGALGLLFAVWGIRFLTVLLANGNDEFTMRPSLNWHVFGVCLALSLITGVLFGLAPALQATRVDVIGALKETRAGQLGLRSRRLSLGQVLVVAQIGISLVLLVAAGLFVRTLSNLQSIQLGFNREGILLFQMNARQAGHRDPEILEFYTGLQQRFSTIPGVQSATLMHYPMVGQGTWSSPVIPAGQTQNAKVFAHVLMTGINFFTTMQVPVVLGRAFDDRDRPGSLPVGIVNQAYVKANFGDRNPIGEHLTIRRGRLENADVEIVGVARNSRYGSLKGEYPQILYLPYNQGSYFPIDGMTFAIRTGGDPLRLVNTVREIARQVDPRVPVTDVKTQSDQIDQTMNQEIIFARLCTAFALLALLIACVGLYGTMSYAVERRTSEIGIRIALGAKRSDIVWMVLRHALAVAAAGLVIGLPVALGASKFVQSFLFGVEPNDTAALVLSVAILVASVLLAGFVPARRASRVDPVTAVRSE